MKDWSDIQLFDAIKQGDKEALSVLFLRHYAYLKHYALQITQDTPLVETCIQDLFMYLFESSERLGSVQFVKAYLFRSLRRRVIEQVKKEQKQRKLQEFLFSPSDIQFAPQDLLLEQAHQSHIRETLLEILNQLPWRQREAIYLRYYNGLKTKEIAEIMGVANQTVLNTLYQALSKIRKNKSLKQLFDLSSSGLLLLTQLWSG